MRIFASKLSKLMNMKIYLLTLFAAALSLSATAQDIDTSKLSEYDKNAPFGWGAGITGGEGGETVTVETYAQLFAQLATNNTTAKIIYVKGTITFSGYKEVRNVKNKTIIGLEGAVLTNPTHSTVASESGILYMRDCENIIIRNLTFKSAGAYDMDGNDNISLIGCTKVWVDHCDFQDGVDGNLDATNSSDNICVTWCRFRYLIAPWPGGSGDSDDHRYTNLWGNSDSRTADQDKLRTTFANCWWDEGCKERMPRVRFGKVHLLNCLYSSSVTNYCVGGGYRSNVYIEKCAFTSNKAKNTPWKNYATSSGKTDYNITITGCSGTSDKQQRSGSIDYFIPSDNYTYDSYASSSVESVVSNSENGAGATLKFKDASGIEGIATSAEVQKVEYYSLDGILVAAPTKGIFIQVTTLKDGTKRTKKIIR